jgi:trehalose synthase
VYNNLSPQYLEKYQPLDPVDLKSYTEIIGKKEVENIRQLAGLLENKTWTNINSTFEGGGVAEMLKSIVPIARGLGINCLWYCIEATDDFYNITKRFHNIIQGLDQHFTLEDLLDLYVNTNKRNFENLRIVADMNVVHDPQPCASVVHGNYEGKMIWRCHIDTSEANELIWNFLLPYINNYDGVIFSHKDFVKEGIKKPVYQIPPSIDPLSRKNRQRTKKEALDTLSDLFEEYGIDPERPIVLAVSRYDIHKNQKTIIKAFKKLKEDREIKKRNPILIIVGNSAADDPEGMEMYAKISSMTEGEPDIYPLLNIPDNDENIGALFKLAKVFIHVSTKEGFGLVVTEALWQGTPVIGSKVGGITLQVINNKTGFLVDPYHVDNIATYTKFLLTNEEECERLGYHAVEFVRENFLITSLVKRYCVLMRFLLGIDFPYFTIR